MLESLITSKTRIKLLLKFFINSNTTAYLRNLATEFGESTNAIRQELNRFEQANLLTSDTVKNRKVYRANQLHPYYSEIHRILLKHTGIDKIIDTILERIGDLEEAYIINEFAEGNPGNILDMVLVGENINLQFLHNLVTMAQELVSFKIKYITVTNKEVTKYIPAESKAFLVWSAKDKS